MLERSRRLGAYLGRPASGRFIGGEGHFLGTGC
jgi:hypothetical protein